MHINRKPQEVVVDWLGDVATIIDLTTSVIIKTDIIGLNVL